MSDVDPALARAVGYALTGGDPAPTGPAIRPEDLIGQLGGTERVRAHAAAVRAAGEPWPHPVPPELRSGLGAAQLHAAIERARQQIDPPPSRPVRRAAAPDADDLRLLREVPPHHGD
ncbi:hypothetical protein [Microlunatus parietis]|uniref:DUF222 domain-containing protein n=1 Tax=Microlunatus parietis TaxID=682979 RepID=A0A7Y9IC63_9ACTN|nr:hypothetical protein [Microlunatus parietis]NYE73594.1 hypothetical protein [Microlunatus parietis]